MDFFKQLQNYVRFKIEKSKVKIEIQKLIIT